MRLSERFLEAVRYATELHADDLRKGTTIPYVAHLLAVASLVLEHGGTEDEVLGALLHDTVEDHGRDGATRLEIEERFGADVLAIVLGCTDAEGERGRQKPPWRARKEKYVAHLRHASPSTRLVSAADKLHNARAIVSDLRVLGDGLWPRFNAGKEGVLWYYRALVPAFREAGGSADMHRLLDELDRVVTTMEALAGGRSS